MYSPYFDRESPQIPIVGMIADLDISPSYELNAMAVFKAKIGYLVVSVSGCSCWPDRGGTEQTTCRRKSDVDKKLTGDFRELLDKCQAKNWKPDKSKSDSP